MTQYPQREVVPATRGISRVLGCTPFGLFAGIIACICGALERTQVRKIVAEGEFTALQVLRAVLPWTVAALLLFAVFF